MKICTIYDSKASHSGPLFCAFDALHAQRLFICSLDESHQCVLYPSDYELRIIGEFHEDVADILSYPHVTDDDRYKIIPVSGLIPEKYKKYCLDGSFENQK